MSEPLNAHDSHLSNDPEPNNAQDAETISDALSNLEADGFLGQFRAVESGAIECFTCHHVNAAELFAVEKMSRLEGASDPADMVTILGVTCPSCFAPGTLTLSYGPDSTIEDTKVLQQIGDERTGSGVAGVSE